MPKLPASRRRRTPSCSHNLPPQKHHCFFHACREYRQVFPLRKRKRLRNIFFFSLLSARGASSTACITKRNKSTVVVLRYLVTKAELRILRQYRTIRLRHLPDKTCPDLVTFSCNTQSIPAKKCRHQNHVFSRYLLLPNYAVLP